MIFTRGKTDRAHRLLFQYQSRNVKTAVRNPDDGDRDGRPDSGLHQWRPYVVLLHVTSSHEWLLAGALHASAQAMPKNSSLEPKS